ncbi:histidine phosphatase family protein [Paenibacillus nanensis]|uniref:Histidine phosphatase family protein n=2 Tax=Paenibacillus nanensis TaxID=393251 RepID=A0A3A1UZQ0_9BACL|nr:histidine phosphatase family protein [Paenibacillus nanensis]
MVRHAESPYIFGEERRRGLSPEGTAAAAKVADLLESEEIHLVCSSSYERAMATVRELAARRNLEIQAFEELVERPILGLHQQMSWELIEEAIKESFDNFDYALEGGETTREVQKRAIPVMEKLLEEYAGKTIVIGTHGNMMTIIMNYYDNRYGYAFWKQSSKPDVYRLTFQENRLMAVERIWE